MIDWGLGLVIGAVAAISSEIAILLAILTPKVPIQKGRTWRGTFTAVTLVSVIVGGVAGYFAGMFGGRGGGGQSGVTATSTLTAQPTKSALVSTPPAPTIPPLELPTLAARVDLSFTRAPGKTVAADFQCQLVGYRRSGSDWRPETSRIEQSTLDAFLPAISKQLNQWAQEMQPQEAREKRLRIFLQPFPGEGVFEQIKRQAEQAGWKVDRIEGAWKLEKPSS
jgi:hypothetical protein